MLLCNMPHAYWLLDRTRSYMNHATRLTQAQIVLIYLQSKGILTTPIAIYSMELRQCWLSFGHITMIHASRDWLPTEQTDSIRPGISMNACRAIPNSFGLSLSQSVHYLKECIIVAPYVLPCLPATESLAIYDDHIDETDSNVPKHDQRCFHPFHALDPTEFAVFPGRG